ncbi:MAG: WD repeat-containing protein 70 [Marteilia pararefringens]
MPEELLSDDSDQFVGPQIPDTLPEVTKSVEMTATPDRLSQLHSIDFHHSSKPLSAICVDNQGVRMTSGSLNGEIKFWEFHGMAHKILPFRNIEHEDLQPIVSLSYNLSNSHLLIANSGRQAKVHSRDGVFVLETPKGYTYISDLSNTNGHIAAISSACFHPFEDNLFLTSSLDSSVRLWNTDRMEKQASIYKMRGPNGRKLPVSCASYSNAAKSIAVGLDNGSILVFDTKLSTINAPIHSFENLHEESCGVNSISFSATDFLMCSRSSDGTCKFIDLRQTNKILKSFDSLPAKYKSVNAAFDPNSNLLITSYSDIPQRSSPINKNSSYTNCGIVLIDVAGSFEIIARQKFTTKVPTLSIWSKKLDQLFVGFSDGTFTGYFDKELYDTDEDNADAENCGKRNRAGLALVSSKYSTDSLNGDYHNSEYIQSGNTCFVIDLSILLNMRNQKLFLAN